MARLTALPSVDIIRGFKKTIDFYLWKGLPCARAWPRYRPARQTDPSKAAALLFGQIIQAYNTLAPQALAAYQETAIAIPRTARDIYVSGVFGNLHERSEPTPPPPPEEVVQILTVQSDVQDTKAADGAWQDVLAMAINITLDDTGIIVCHFTTEISMIRLNWEYMYLRFDLDGSTQSEEYTKRRDANATNNERYLLHCHTVFDAVAAGPHTVKVQTFVAAYLTPTLYTRRLTILSLEP